MNIIVCARSVENAEAPVYASIFAGKMYAENAMEAESVSTGNSGPCAKIAKGQAYVSMQECALSAKIAKVQVSASTTVGGLSVESAKDLVYVNMTD